MRRSRIKDISDCHRALEFSGKGMHHFGRGSFKKQFLGTMFSFVVVAIL